MSSFNVQWENMSGSNGYTKRMGLFSTIMVLYNLYSGEKLSIERE